MKLTVRAMYENAAVIEDDKERKSLVAHARRSESEARLRAAVALAATDQRVIAHPEVLDHDPMLLNVANGTVHLEFGEILDADPADLITKLAPVEYDHGAEAPTWLDFLERVTNGRQELIEFLQRAVGYSLTGLTNAQVFFVLYGTGANGKSTFIETLRALLGDYGQQTPAETFLERRGESVPNDLARLPGARFVSAVETPEGRRLNETAVKRLTGEDTITARFMRGEWFEFRPVFKCWLATNHRPDVRGTDEAIWRRVRLVPFTVTIPPAERDPDLPAKLRAELPGILRWAVEGCLAWRQDGLGDPEPVTAATAAYRSEMDTLGSFLEECCVLREDVVVKAGDLHEAYTVWSGDRTLTKKALGLRLAERGFQPIKRRDGRWWKGVGLRYEGDDV
jgi:putative DNA primase/helicase